MSPSSGHQSFSLPTGCGGLLGAEMETRRFSLSASTVVKGAQHGGETCKEAQQMMGGGGYKERQRSKVPGSVARNAPCTSWPSTTNRE